MSKKAELLDGMLVSAEVKYATGLCTTACSVTC